MTRYWLLWLLVNLGGRLPTRLQYGFAWLAGTLAWYGSRRIREVTRDHARHVLGIGTPLGRVDAVARGCVRTNLYYYADFARFGVATPESIFDSFDEIVGLDLLLGALDEGRGVVLVSAHLGNGEVLAPASAPFGICLAVVTERLQPPKLHDFVHRVRGARGVTFLPADGGGLRASVAHLRAGGSLGLLVDRDVLGTADLYPFFGEPAPMPSGAVELALRVNAPMFAAWVPRTGIGRYSLYLEQVPLPPPCGSRQEDVERGMQAMLRTIEDGIRHWPDQWFPLAPIWGSPSETE